MTADDVEKADTFDADLAVTDADPDRYDALVLPGGTTNADALRQDTDAVAFVRAFADAGKPVAAICHGPWALVTSRNPDDLDAFVEAAAEAFAGQ